MGGSEGTFSVEESVNNMRKLAEDFKSADSGHLYSYDGTIIPW
jgi:hypothetical protein